MYTLYMDTTVKNLDNNKRTLTLIRIRKRIKVATFIVFLINQTIFYGNLCTMFSEDNESIVITIPKKRSFSGKSFVAPHYKKRNCVIKKYERNISDDEFKRYTLPDEEFLLISKLKQPETLLPFRQYSKREHTKRFKREQAISMYEKYKILSCDLRRRLHVNDPINDVNSVTDIDKDFYRYVDGRPLSVNIPGFKSIKTTINKKHRLRQEIGVQRDCVLNKETYYRNELDIYDLALKRLTDQAKYFDAFISVDYRISMSFLTKCDKLKFEVDLKIKELQNLSIEKFAIKSGLISLEYKYGLQQKYGRFLNYLSPPSWRYNNREFARSIEIEAKGFDFGNSHEEDTFAMLFEKLCNICYSTSIRPVLYFTQPKDLMDVFCAMENQQLHYYTHVNHFTPYAKKLKEDIKLLKDLIFQDYATVANLIKVYENLLNFCEERCAQLEVKFYKILFGMFYNSVGEPEVLKLILHLDYCYERVFLERPINLDLIVMANSIEKVYMDYSKHLDEIQNTNVRRIMLRCVENDRSKIKRAKYAAKELRLFHRLERQLLRAHGITTEPLKTNTDIQSNQQYDLLDKPNTEIIKRKTLTEAQMEYLMLFTDWNEKEDPANYLQGLNFNEHTNRKKPE